MAEISFVETSEWRGGDAVMPPYDQNRFLRASAAPRIESLTEIDLWDCSRNWAAPSTLKASA